MFRYGVNTPFLPFHNLTRVATTSDVAETEEQKIQEFLRVLENGRFPQDDYGHSLIRTDLVAAQPLSRFLLDLKSNVVRLYHDGECKGFGLDITTFLHITQPEFKHDLKSMKEYVLDVQKKTQFPMPVILRLQILHPLIQNGNFFFLHMYRRFRVFDIMYWINGTQDTSMDLDLIARLTHNEKHLAPSNLTDVCTRFDNDSRELLAIIFLHLLICLVGPASALALPSHFATQEECIQFTTKIQRSFQYFWTPINENAELEQLRFTSNPAMPDQRPMGNEDLVRLMRFVNDSMKYHLVALSQFGVNQPEYTDNASRITPEFVRLTMRPLIAKVTSDFFAFFYTKVFNWLSIDEFVQSVRYPSHSANTLTYVLVSEEYACTDFKLPFIRDYVGFEGTNSEVSPEMLHGSVRRISEQGLPICGHEVRLKSDCSPIVRFTPTPFRQQYPLTNLNHQEHLNTFRLIANQPPVTAEVTTNIAGVVNSESTEPSYPLRVFESRSTQPGNNNNNNNAGTQALQITGANIFGFNDMYTFFPYLPFFNTNWLANYAKSWGPENFGILKTFFEKRRKWELENPYCFGLGGPQLENFHLDASKLLRQSPTVPSTTPDNNSLIMTPGGQSGSSSSSDRRGAATAGASSGTNQQNGNNSSSTSDRRELVDYTAFLEDYNNDFPDSDNEMELHDQEDRVFETNYAVVDYTETLEEFYSEILNWVVSPDDFHKDFHINSEPIRNAKWLERFYASEVGRHIKDNVTQCSNLQEYAAHMRGVLLLHTRANVYSALRTEPFDQMRAENSPFMLRLYNDDLHEPEFQQLEVSSVAASEKLLHITVESEDEELNRHLVETSLRGMTLCLARVTKQQQQ